MRFNQQGDSAPTDSHGSSSTFVRLQWFQLDLPFFAFHHALLYVSDLSWLRHRTAIHAKLTCRPPPSAAMFRIDKILRCIIYDPLLIALREVLDGGSQTEGANGKLSWVEVPVRFQRCVQRIDCLLSLRHAKVQYLAKDVP